MQKGRNVFAVGAGIIDFRKLQRLGFRLTLLVDHYTSILASAATTAISMVAFATTMTVAAL